MLKKILKLLLDTGRTLAPAAGELLHRSGKAAGKLGSAGTKLLRRKFNIRTRAVKHRTRRFLRRTLAFSLLISAVSFMGLLLTHRKN